MKIALDMMGGDHAPENQLDATAQILESSEKLAKLVLVGDRDTIMSGLKERGISPERVEIAHASEVVSMHDAPALAIRKKKDSSISVGVDLVKDGKADAIVSAGNTGAMVAASKLKLRTLEGIERPAIAIVIPNPKGVGVLLDIGANSECKPSHFLQFAFMGRAYATYILGIDNPSVGLMSIGEESSKGSDIIRQSHKLLKEHDVNFQGNIEPINLFDGKVDIMVCDGFTGNVIIKTGEALMTSLERFLRKEISESFLCKMGAALLKPAFKRLKKRADHEAYGGAPLLGVNGVCIICHGRSTPNAIIRAVEVAQNFVENQINNYIQEQIKVDKVLEKYQGEDSDKEIKSIPA